jgi:hypothetical protein
MTFSNDAQMVNRPASLACSSSMVRLCKCLPTPTPRQPIACAVIRSLTLSPTYRIVSAGKPCDASNSSTKHTRVFQSSSAPLGIHKCLQIPSWKGALANHLIVAAQSRFQWEITSTHARLVGVQISHVGHSRRWRLGSPTWSCKSQRTPVARRRCRTGHHPRRERRRFLRTNQA